MIVRLDTQEPTAKQVNFITPHYTMTTRKTKEVYSHFKTSESANVWCVLS